MEPKYRISQLVFAVNTINNIVECGYIKKVEVVLNGKSFHYTIDKFTFCESDIYSSLEEALDAIKKYYEWQMEDKIRSLTYQYLNRNK